MCVRVGGGGRFFRRSRFSGARRREGKKTPPTTPTIQAASLSFPSHFLSLSLSNYLIDHRRYVILGRANAIPPLPGLGDVGVQIRRRRRRHLGVGGQRRRQRQRRRPHRRRQHASAPSGAVLGPLGRGVLLSRRGRSHSSQLSDRKGREGWNGGSRGAQKEAPATTRSHRESRRKTENEK